MKGRKDDRGIAGKISAVGISSVIAILAMVVLLAVSAFAGPPSPNALPTGGQITAGSGNISQSGNLMTVNQLTDKMVANWQTYNIGQNAGVTYQQPGFSSIALNRILGQDPSQIYGRLTANGQVFLLNPAGVIFGPTSRVDVGGIVASTLNMSDADFLAGKYNFKSTGTPGTILNQGNITTAPGGVVAFISQNVKNEGAITAPGGKVALAAGNAVSLDFAGDGLINVTVSESSVNALVENKGIIKADGGMVVMSAKAADSLLATVVNNEGIIEAKGISEKNGVIILDGGDSGLTQVSGTLDASASDAGMKGGTVCVLGKNVSLVDNAVINASGVAGGGTVMIGGGLQGKNPALHNALTTFVGSGVTITADAKVNGDGGKVVVWSDDTTRFLGNISVRGGAQMGDGGFVEVSGKEYLTFKGNVDTQAPHGKTGLLLLDPADIIIANGTGDGGTPPDGSTTFKGEPVGSAGTVLSGDTGPTTIYESELEGLAAATNISLAATNSITINNLTTDGNLNLAQTAGNSVSFSAGVGGFTIQNTANTITTAGGALTITTTGGGGATIGNLATNGGLVTIDVSGASSIAGVISGTGALTKIGAGTLTLSGANLYTGLESVLRLWSVSIDRLAWNRALLPGTTKGLSS